MIVFKDELWYRTLKLMKKIYYSIIVALCLNQNLWADQDSTLLVSTPSMADTSKSQNIAIDTIDIGADAFYTPFIFSEELNDDAEGIKEMVEERAFAYDEFFMRNIDREEFEMEREFLQFENKDKKKKKSPFAPSRIYTSQKNEKIETINPDKK
jgi:hypothetical protein